MTRTSRQQLGDAGEGLARRLLEADGYHVLAEQWRCREGELDLVMQRGKELVFVEVKLRHTGLLAPEETVTPAQQRRLLLAAQRFVAAHPDLSDCIWRIDVVAITLDASGSVYRVNHLENAVSG